MRNKIIYICFTCLCCAFYGNAQNKKLEKANKSFEDFNYFKAISQYEGLVKKGNASPEVYQNLGDANYMNANYEDAAKWYEQLSNLDKTALDKEHIYRYAQSLRSIKKYEASDVLMRQLNTSIQNDQRGINYNENQDYLIKIKERFGSYTVDNLSINSPESDFAPSFRLDGIVFSSGRDTSGITKNIHNWNKKSFLELYTATNTENESFKNAIKFSKRLNTKLHESSTAFTKDGNTIYFTRNNGKRGKFSRDKEGISRLKIYKAVFENGEWGKAKALPFNSNDYSVAHPSLNKAEDKLYFASDMPGTLGHSDIYVVDINADGTYGKPQNLGNRINTESKESFPYVSEEDILYFASDGHPGLGGMDIFATDLKNIDNSLIVNLGEPLNSVSDDFSLIINSTTKKGYFASNRINGVGSDDIYALTEIKPLDVTCLKKITGVVRENKTRAIVANAIVVLYSANNEILEKTVSDGAGAFEMKTSCLEESFSIIARKESYQEDLITLENEAVLANIELLLRSIDIGAPIGTDLAKYLEIEPIYFDLDKWFIREDSKKSIEKIIAYLNKYPQTKVQIGSHTDARASKAYNMRLSDKRANSTMQYLIDQGISKNRLNALGFGESMITNGCVDEIRCPENQHQQNRRSEFIVVDLVEIMGLI